MSIWVMPISIELLTERSKNTIVAYLGIEFTEIGDEYLEATMPVDHRTKQPLGLLHGGSSCVLGETLGSSAANYCVDQKMAYCIGTEISATHIRSARSGLVRGVAVPLHLGRRTQVWEIKNYNEEDKLLCVLRHTVMTLQRAAV